MSRRGDSDSGRRARHVIRGALVAAVLCALAPAAAQASPPRITKAPEVAGTPQVGQTLRAEGAEWRGRPEPTASWEWLRCTSLDMDDCVRIGGATASTYTAVEADSGRRLRVRLTVRNEDGWAWALSSASPVIAPAPVPTPAPTPAPTPIPEPTPPPAPPAAPVAPLAPAVPEGAVLPGTAVPPKLMRPTPLVRIRGRLSRRGAQITLLTVEAPRGARIAIRCIGRGCPARRWAKMTAVTRIARFQRDLRAGTKLVVTVTKPGRIGKHTTIVIRAGKAPARRDRCLMPGSGRPVACPSV